MKIRQVPELHFRHDESLERGARLSALIDDAIAADRRARDADDAD
jgi:ribosome-binding factor A